MDRPPLLVTGEFKTLAPHFAGECSAVTGAIGAEDVVIHHATGVAIVSAADRREAMAGRSPRGGIHLYALAHPERGLRNLTPAASSEFYPHGLSLYVGADGRTTLFAVNHERGRHTVEVYRWNGEALSQERTIANDLTRPTVPAPSQVFRIEPGSGAVEEIYLDLGTSLSGSSVGAFHDGRLLIGTVFDPKFLDCRLR